MWSDQAWDVDPEMELVDDMDRAKSAECRNLEDKVNTGSGQSEGKNGLRSPRLKS